MICKEDYREADDTLSSSSSDLEGDVQIVNHSDFSINCIDDLVSDNWVKEALIWSTIVC